MSRRPLPIAVEDWTDARHRRGAAGERSALQYLRDSGWLVLAHRFRLGHHDIDIVARAHEVVAFIEVKTRTSTRFGGPLAALSARQRASIARVADAWRLRHGRRGDTYRFDLIGVSWDENTAPTIEHIPDAWRPER